jgi:23S rRNA pseudouridine1911/1915/1917 synthase
MVDILHEDSHLLVCVKPVGILSQPDLSGGEDMLTLLKTYLENKNENPYIGLVHRLDRNVGGVMVFSKKQNVTAKLSEAIQQRNFTKEYYAVVHNCPQEMAGIYKDLLFKDSSKNKSFVVDRPRKGVKEASLEYNVLGTKSADIGEISLIRISLHTGRTHQIRVQFSSRKMPLVGDGKYGSKDNGCEISLWSYRLAFRHPIKQKDIDYTQGPPNCYPWNLFKTN